MSQPATTNILESVNPTVTVGKQIRDYMSKGTLRLPHDYSPENALKSAWLLLQSVQDKDKKPALTVCTKESICNAVLSMAIQGLNPDKKQCYFIVYGSTLLCQRSYFGDEALAKRVMPGIHLYYDVIYEGETFATAKERCSIGLVTRISKHEQPFPRKSNTIVGAYCGVIDSNGEDLGIELMDWAQIQKSWGMSKTAKFDNSPHKDFPDQMALRTVIRRRCKPIINSSSDELLMTAVREAEMDAADAQIAEEAEPVGNGEIIELPQNSAPAPEEPKEEKKPKGIKDEGPIDEEQPSLEGDPY